MIETTEVLLLAVTAVFLAAAYVLHRFRRIPIIANLPEIDGSPFWGVAHTYYPVDGKTNVHKTIQEWVMMKGKVVQFYIFNHLFVLINDGKLARAVFEQVKNKRQILGQGIVEKNISSLPTNDEWKRRRNQFRHAFTISSLRLHESTLGSIVKNFFNMLSSAAQHQNGIVLIDQLFGQFALTSIFTIAFEMEINFLDKTKLFDEMYRAIQDIFQFSWIRSIPLTWILLRLPEFVPVPEIIHKYRKVNQILRKFDLLVLQHFRKKHAEGSFKINSFGKLLMDFEVAEKPSERDLLSEIRIFIIAGFETTAHSLSWIIYSLCKNPEIQTKCHQVVDDWFAQHSSAGDTSLSMLTPLPDYLEAVIKESMRKYPTLTRGSIRLVDDPNGFPLDMNNGQPPVVIPCGAFVTVNFFCLHNDPDIWGHDAAEFNPDRWLMSPWMSSPAAYAGTGIKADEITFAPFAAGPRNCVGMNFAMWEIRSLMLNLLRDFAFEFADDQMQNEEKALKTDVTMKPLNQLPVKVIKRCRNSRN